MFTPARIVAGLLGTTFAALAIGIPTGIVETSRFTRMTPVLWWNYPVWAISSMLTGALIATYVRSSLTPGTRSHSGKTLGGGLLSAFAVGCPICNKMVVLAIGVNGALTWFAPIQPVLALVSVGVLAYALRSRIRSLRACAVAHPPVPSQSR